MSAVALETPVRLGPEMAGTLMTPEEFDAVPDYDDEWCYELVHGVLVVHPVPLDAEVGPNEYLGNLLWYYQTHHQEGKILDATLPERYVQTKDSRRRADRLIWAGLGRKPNTRKDRPTIAVEFVSRGKRDRHRDYIEKRSEYAKLGIAEYWIVDRFRRTMTVYRPKPPKVKVIKEDEVYRTPLLPGFELPLYHLLDVADQWATDA